MSASELADWWDKQRRKSHAHLEQWVMDNPQWWTVALATTIGTAMDLGAGTVDALRLGEGIAEGTAGGYGKDALRAMIVVGPAARGASLLGRLAQTHMIKLAVTTQGVTGPCTFTAVNNAASIITGRARNFFVTARDAASALGKSLRSVEKADDAYKLAAWIDDLVPFLTQQGMRMKNLGKLNSIDDVAAAAAREDGVIVFAIEWTDLAGKIQRHSMIAVRTVMGVRYADYGGRFISSLAELAKRGGLWQTKDGFRIATTAQKGAAVLFEGMKSIGVLERHALEVMGGGSLVLSGVTAVETNGGVELAIPMSTGAVINSRDHEPEVIKASLENYVARKAGRRIERQGGIKLRGRKNAPPRADWLTGVQYRLNALGFGAGAVDGIKGPKTTKALREFQRAFPPLRVDGIPGPETQSKLVELCGF